MRMLIVATFVFSLMTPCFAETPLGVDINLMARESQPVAKASLSTLSKLVSEENAPRMGFSGPGDVERSQLDVPLSDFMVGLDSLREYQKGKDTLSLLRSTGQVVYPVRVDGVVCSSITLQKQGTSWQAVSFGAPVLTKALNGARETVAKRDKLSTSEYFQIRIPAFNLIFVGHVANDKLMLSSVTDAEMYGIKAGLTQQAEEIYLRLKPEAERDTGLPR